MSIDAFHPATPEELRLWRDDLDRQGKRLVFTNGCFDLLHPGHVRYLGQARALGDALLVAINSDASVRALKGPTRPINSELDRAEVVSALRCVDAVVIFNDLRATQLIESIQPHLYAKGGDYTPDSLNAEEKAALERAGTTIHILPLVPGRSTTATLERMRPSALRLGVLGSGEGSNLLAIVQAIEAGELNAEVVVAVTDEKESGFLRLAAQRAIKHAVVECGDHPLRTTEASQQAIHDRLVEAGVEVVVLAGFMRILKEPTLSKFEGRIVNVHPSLLPRHKGRHAVREALAAGDAATGCTVHLVTVDIDAGRHLAQAEVAILPGDDEATLHQRIKEQEHRLLPRVLNDWRSLGLPTGR